MRIPDQEQVNIEVVSEDGSRRTINGAFGFFESRFLMLTVRELISSDCALSFEHTDILFVGAVLGCKPGDDPNTFHICMHVEHTLTALQSLTRMRERLLGLELGLRTAKRPNKCWREIPESFGPHYLSNSQLLAEAYSRR